MNSAMLLILGQQQAQGFDTLGDALGTMLVIGGIVFVLLVIGAAISSAEGPPAPPPTFVPYEPNPLPQEILPAIIQSAAQPMHAQPPWPPGQVIVKIDKVIINYVTNGPPLRPDHRWIEQNFSDQQPL